MWAQTCSSNDIYHHGILGQKWGQRNGPPYPLKAGAHSSSEKKAGWKKSLGDGRNESEYGRSAKERKKDVGKSNKRTDVKSFIERQGSTKLSSGALADYAPIAMTYLATTAAVMAYSALINVLANKAHDRRVKDLKNNKDFNNLKDIPKLKHADTAESAMSKVNPEGPVRPETSNNCVLCSMAMAARKKGYDVKAAESKVGFYTNKLVKDAFTDPRSFKIDTSKIIFKKNEKTISNEINNATKPGQYGTVTVYWFLGGGHCMFWENDRGRVRIYDGQCNKEYMLSEVLPFIKGDIEFEDVSASELKDEITGYVRRRA